MNHKMLQIPFEADKLVQKKKRIRRELLESDENFQECKIAILGGSTTSLLKDILELFLLDSGIKPIFYESEYNKWYEDIYFENAELAAFNPQIIYISTSFVNIDNMPEVKDDSSEIVDKIEREYHKYEVIWKKAIEKYNATVIQNNFEFPSIRFYGNIDLVNSSGVINFIQTLNQKFAQASKIIPQLYIQDIQYLSSYFGIYRWFDEEFYALYKVAVASDMIPHLALNLAAMIRGFMGKSKKCLVLDLDQTLWGGIIGEDGIAGLKIGNETPLGEAYLKWQKYILNLKDRGIILAVCSKNDMEIAKSGFSHPDCLLKFEDFVSFQANWNDKPLNIKNIAQEINIGLDSMVFIDDNPVERAIVREQLPMVTVPEVDGGDPFSYIRVLEIGRYFEVISVSSDDFHRNETYMENKNRQLLENDSSSYEEFLKKLDMKAEIDFFKDVYIERIAQLTNKTNQFNLTTKRYAFEELRDISKDDDYIAIYGRLKDCYGDNGLVSIMIGEIISNVVHVRLWIMSCRVFKRNMEFAMFDEFVLIAKSKNISKIIGYYYPTKKNDIVRDLYKQFGFRSIFQKEDGSSVWEFDISGDYNLKNEIISIERHKNL